MNSNSPIEPIQIDRLIDGELTRDQIRNLLNRSTSDPGWQQIAQAFVEDRIWRTEIKASVESSGKTTESNIESNGLPKFAWAETETVDEGFKKQLKQAEDLTLDSRHEQNRKSKSNWSWLALVAGVFIASGIGFLVGRGGVDSDQYVAETNGVRSAPIAQAVGAVAGGAESSTDSGQTLTALDPFASDPDFHLGFRDENGNSMFDTDIPLYTTSDMQAGLPAFERPPISDEMRKSLHGSGYEFKEKTRYIAGQLNDGRPFVVPIRTINLSAGQ